VREDLGLTMTAEQVILKLMSALQHRSPKYREDSEALEAARSWLDSNRKEVLNRLVAEEVATGLGDLSLTMIYDATNAGGAKVFDVDTKEEIGQVLAVNPSAGFVQVAEQPLRATKHGQIASRLIRFASIYAIKDHEHRPVLFHCYGRKTDPSPLMAALAEDFGLHRIGHSEGAGDCYGVCRGGIGNTPGTAEALRALANG
jgi:hypothetical protein